MLNILITGAGTITANNVIQTLKDSGKFRIVVTDINRKELVSGSYFADKFYRVPYGIDNKFIPELLGIVKKEKIDVLIPIVDEELLSISRNKKKFERLGTKVVISSPKTIAVCNDKYKMYLALRKNKVLTPDTFLPKDVYKINDAEFPLVIKPRWGKGSVGVCKIFDKEGLYSLLKQDKDVIIQKHVNGQEYTIDIFCDRNSEVKVAVPRLRLEIKAGVSYKGRTVKDLYLIKTASKIVRFLHIFGPANLQCIKSKGKFYFLEVNPRFSGGLPLTVKSGANTPLMAIDLVQGKSIPKQLEFSPNLNMVRYVKEIFF
jgi:carbamoyl-phosphate synthase large subunit